MFSVVMWSCIYEAAIFHESDQDTNVADLWCGVWDCVDMVTVNHMCAGLASFPGLQGFYLAAVEGTRLRWYGMHTFS